MCNTSKKCTLLLLGSLDSENSLEEKVNLSVGMELYVSLSF